MAYNACKRVRAVGPSAVESAAYEEANPTVEKEHSHMPPKRAPRRMKAQELRVLLQGQTEATTGEEWLGP